MTALAPGAARLDRPAQVALVAAVVIGLAWTSTRAPAVAGLTAVLLWAVLPREETQPTRRTVLLLTAFTFAGFAPYYVALAVQLAALLLAWAEWAAVPAASRRGTRVVVVVGIVMGLWALLLLHPNVPDLQTGLLGFRKSVLALAGLVLGCSVAPRRLVRTELLVVGLLVTAMAVSVVMYLYLPSVQHLIAVPDADTYTGEFAGRVRLQGVFAGPFHAATCGVAIVSWGLVRWRRWRCASAVSIAVGLVGTYLTYVRGSYVALGIVVLALILMSGSAARLVRRLSLVAVASTVLLLVVGYTGGGLLGTVSTIGDLSSDSRFQGRLPLYRQGLQMVVDSPFWGWGDGSAGDTLDAAFAQGRHVTAHNIALKYAVEGGLLGLVLVVVLLVLVWRSIDRSTGHGQAGAVMLVALGALGLTDSAVETLPVSYLIMVLVGLAVRDRGDGPPRRRTATPRVASRARTRGGASGQQEAPGRFLDSRRSRGPAGLGRRPGAVVPALDSPSPSQDERSKTSDRSLQRRPSGQPPHASDEHSKCRTTSSPV